MLVKSIFGMMCSIFFFSIAAQAQVQTSYHFTKLDHAKTWNEAREKCQKLGKGWDLPTPNQIQLILQKEMATVLEYYEIGRASVWRDYVMWVRAENEDHNIQLQDRSTALRYNPRTDEISELDLSREAFAEMSFVKKQIENLPIADIRTAEEQEKFENAVQDFELRYPFARIEFNLYEPYSLDHPLLRALPPDIFTQEILRIMLKFSSEALDVMSINIDTLLHGFVDGLEAVCMTSVAQTHLGKIGTF